MPIVLNSPVGLDPPDPEELIGYPENAEDDVGPRQAPLIVVTDTASLVAAGLPGNVTANTWNITSDPGPLSRVHVKVGVRAAFAGRLIATDCDFDQQTGAQFCVFIAPGYGMTGFTATYCRFQRSSGVIDSDTASNGAIQVNESDLIASHCDISGCPDGVQGGNDFQLTWCWIHDPIFGSEAHVDGADIDGSGWVIRNSNIVIPNGPAASVNGAVWTQFNESDYADGGLTIVEDSRLEGGGFTVHSQGGLIKCIRTRIGGGLYGNKNATNGGSVQLIDCTALDGVTPIS